MRLPNYEKVLKEFEQLVEETNKLPMEARAMRMLLEIARDVKFMREEMMVNHG